MERLKEIFGRVVTRLTHPDEKITVPLEYLEKVFRLNDDAYVQNRYFQTMVDFGLGINDMNRPAATRVYQTHPGDKVFVTVQSDGIGEGEIRSFPASPLIAQTDFRLSMLSHKRAIGIMIRPRLERASDDITVAFGLYGVYDPKDGNVVLQKLMIHDPRTDQTIRPHLHEETVVRALEFARLCVAQQFARQTMNLNNNMHMAETLQGADLKPGWKSARPPETPQP